MSLKVLIVDADELSTGLVDKWLAQKGWQTSSSASGKEALDALKTDRSIDLVVVGENLNDIDGIGFLGKLRQTGSKVKAVFLADHWRTPEAYQILMKELKVALVFHLPLKASLFTLQVEDIFEEPAKTPVNDVIASRAGTGSGAGPIPAAEFHASYLLVLPKRLKELTDSISNARSNRAERGLLEEAKRLAHNMKGVASSSGLEEVGRAAGGIENAILRIQDSPANGAHEAWDEVDRFLASAQAAGEVAASLSLDGKHEGVDAKEAAMARMMVVTDESAPDFDFKAKHIPFELLTVKDQSEALKVAKMKMLDVAIIDLTSGDKKVAFALARQLRSLDEYENLPLGFITDGLPEDERAEGIHAGGSVFLKHPLSEEDLYSAATHLISRRTFGRPRIMMVEDDQDFAAIVMSTLAREGMLVNWVSDPHKTLESLAELVPHLMLLDVNMPGMNGYEVCKQIRSNQRWRDLPILFLTAQTGAMARMNAFEAGGDDYLLKPVVSAELIMRVKLRLERARFMKERTDTDVLTGLLLRGPFMEQVSFIQAEAKKKNSKFTLGLLDVDHFKKVNDTYGHLAGDRVLKGVGNLVRKRFRAEDLRGRWGGEEFILAFADEGCEAMQKALLRVLEELRATVFEGDHGESFSVTFSSGLATYPDDGETIEALLARADHRLYLGKEAGRNRIVIEG